MSNKFDAETNAQLSRAAAIEAMMLSAGWEFAMQDLNAIVADLRDVGGIDTTREDVATQIIVNKAIADNLTQWVDDLNSQVTNGIIMTEGVKTDSLVERR